MARFDRRLYSRDLDQRCLRVHEDGPTAGSGSEAFGRRGAGGGRVREARRVVPGKRGAAGRVVEERHLAHGPARVELRGVRDAQQGLARVEHLSRFCYHEK